MRILVIDSDPASARSLRHVLEENNYDVKVAEYGREGVGLAKISDRYDLILLQLNLTDIEGYQVLRLIRSFGIGTPIMVLSTKRSKNYREAIDCLDFGADDYLPAPYYLPEVMVRVKAILRRSRRPDPHLLEIGELLFDFAKRRVTFRSERLCLTSLEYFLLEALALHVDELMTLKQIHAHIYDREVDIPASNTVDVFYCRIQKKIGKKYIKRIRGSGFVLSAPHAVQAAE